MIASGKTPDWQVLTSAALILQSATADRLYGRWLIVRVINLNAAVIGIGTMNGRLLHEHIWRRLQGSWKKNFERVELADLRRRRWGQNPSLHRAFFCATMWSPRRRYWFNGLQNPVTVLSHHKEDSVWCNVWCLSISLNCTQNASFGRIYTCIAHVVWVNSLERVDTCRTWVSALQTLKRRWLGRHFWYIVMDDCGLV